MASRYRHIGCEIDYEERKGKYYDNKGYLIASINFSSDEIEFWDVDYTELQDAIYNELVSEYNNKDQAFTDEDYTHFTNLIYQ